MFQYLLGPLKVFEKFIVVGCGGVGWVGGEMTIQSAKSSLFSLDFFFDFFLT